jgi:tellurite methyltransferase
MEDALPQHEREKWNKRYREATHGTQPPDQFLIDAFDRYIDPIFPNKGGALDVAGGTGRHAIFLASKGWNVLLTDIAEQGIENASMNADSLAGRMEFAVEDLTRFQARGRQYELILVFFFLQREIFPELVTALKPGGLLIYKSYTRHQTNFKGGPTNPDFLFAENELLNTFRDLRILHYAELIRDCGMAELVAQKI